MVESCQASHDGRRQQSESVARLGREGQALSNLEAELLKSRQVSQDGDFNNRPLRRKPRAPRCIQAPGPTYIILILQRQILQQWRNSKTPRIELDENISHHNGSSGVLAFH